MSKSKIEQVKLNQEQRQEISEALTYFFSYENDFVEMMDRLLTKKELETIKNKINNQ